MGTKFTVKNLDDVEDQAPKFDLEEIQEYHFGRRELDCEQTGLSLYRLKAGKRSPFGHKHDHQEEIYVVIGGSGKARLDDEIIDIGPLDAVRVAPTTVRGFEAGPDGLTLLMYGTGEDDAQILNDWWT